MPLPAGLLKTVLALEELHDFAREFAATEGGGANKFPPQGVPARTPETHQGEKPTNLSHSQSLLSFLRALMGAWGALSRDSLHPGLE